MCGVWGGTLYIRANTQHFIIIAFSWLSCLLHSLRSSSSSRMTHSAFHCFLCVFFLTLASLAEKFLKNSFSQQCLDVEILFFFTMLSCWGSLLSMISVLNDLSRHVLWTHCLFSPWSSCHHSQFHPLIRSWAAFTVAFTWLTLCTFWAWAIVSSCFFLTFRHLSQHHLVLCAAFPQ